MATHANSVSTGVETTACAAIKGHERVSSVSDRSRLDVRTGKN